MFRGRKKDVIVTSAGLNIYPDDLVAALSRQSGVRGAAVVEANGSSGPEPLAVLILTGGLDAAQVIANANAQLSEFQQIRRWVIWPEPDLPRTSTGKVLHREILRRIESGEVDEPGEGSAILDSLGRVELQARLEQQFGVALDDAAAQQVRTEEEMRRLLSAPDSRPRRSDVDHIFPRWVWSPTMQAIRAVFLELVAMPILRFLAAPRVRNLVSEWPDQPVLIVANHITSYDAAFLLYALPGRLRRRVAIAMAGEMVADLRHGRNQGSWFVNLVAPVGYVLMTALFNVFPLPQYSGFRQSFAYAGEAMERGYSVIVFPEGKRSEDGRPLPFKQGAGLLWQELRAKALAMRIDGLGELKAHKSPWFRSGKITVSTLSLISPPERCSPAELTEDLKRGVFG